MAAAIPRLALRYQGRRGPLDGTNPAARGSRVCDTVTRSPRWVRRTPNAFLAACPHANRPPWLVISRVWKSSNCGWRAFT